MIIMRIFKVFQINQCTVGQKLSHFVLLCLFSYPSLTGITQTGVDIQHLVDSLCGQSGVPAVSVAFIQGDSISLAHFNSKHVLDYLPQRRNRVFHLGSNAKAVAATIAARLVEQGHITWQTKMVDVIPELRKVTADYANVTIADLLAHRAGFPPFEDDGSKEWKAFQLSNARQIIKPIDLTMFVCQLDPTALTTENHLYSNAGYIVAALMLERVTGKKWARLLDEFNAALDLNFAIGYPSPDTLGNFGHLQRKIPWLKQNPFRIVPPDSLDGLLEIFSPAGNLSIDLESYTKFIQMHLKGLRGQSRFLSPQTYHFLHRGFEKYALGWYSGKVRSTGESFSYHGGSLGSYSSAVFICPARELAIIVLTNAAGSKIDKLKNKIREAIWNRYSNPTK